GALQLRLEPAVRAFARSGDGARDARRNASRGRLQGSGVLLDVRPEILFDESLVEGRDLYGRAGGRRAAPDRDRRERVTSGRRRRLVPVTWRGHSCLQRPASPSG